MLPPQRSGDCFLALDTFCNCNTNCNGQIIFDFVIVPAFLGPVAAARGVALLTDTSLDDARRDGWLYPAAKSSGCLDHWRGFDYANINLRALLQSEQGPTFVVEPIGVLVFLLLPLFPPTRPPPPAPPTPPSPRLLHMFFVFFIFF